MTSDDARRLATVLRERGLDSPARLLADAHRPLAPLLADLGAAIGPLLRVAGADSAHRLLSDPGVLDVVIEALDRSEESRAGTD